MGSHSFSTKAGLHVSAIAKDTRTYEHVEPETVGNRRNILISELSGKSNIVFKAREMGISLKDEGKNKQRFIKKSKRHSRIRDSSSNPQKGHLNY